MLNNAGPTLLEEPSQTDSTQSQGPFAFRILDVSVSYRGLLNSELPDVADIFRSHKSTTNSNVSGPRPVAIQRSMVKATTFDGKTVYFRKKPKHIESTPRVGIHYDILHPIH